MNGASLEQLRSIEDFLYLEADLLDERRYEEWLDLLDSDLEYTMPLRQNVHSSEPGREFTNPGEDMLWFDEGKDTLTKRVQQLRTGQHWAEEPFSRVSHLVTNIRVVGTDENGLVEVSSRFVVHRNRVATESDTLIGRRRDHLRPTAEGWLLRKRHLLLDQNVLLIKNLTVFF